MRALPAAAPRHLGFDFLGLVRNCRTESAGISGIAQITDPRLRRDAMLRAACRRELLIADLRDARRDHRPTCSISRDLRAVTEFLLSRGNDYAG